MSESAKVYNINENSAISDPGPLGLAAFALTTFCLSVVNTGLVPGKVEGMIIAPALVYGGAVQILAGLWEFKKNNVFGCTAFSSFGAFWISFALYLLFAEWGFIEASSFATGLFLISWTIFTAYMWIGSFALNNALVAVFTLLLLTFILLDIGTMNVSFAHTCGGYAGIATALAAWYASAAGILNSVYKKTVLPIGQKHK
ncbi:MAG: acetate uptake transporter [Clostridiales bacterium]|nr:acetate uptake transporter [Clostridiales bacterium]MCF8022265.1 acetate uptake transporter [Clostridiales bacterium]